MADKLSPIIYTALTRAAMEPHGLPLIAGKSVDGLFPATAIGRAAAKRSVDDGHLECRAEGKQEVATITDHGRAFLHDAANPKSVLEDVVRILERRQQEMDELCANVREVCGHLAATRALVTSLSPTVLAQRAIVPANLGAEVISALAGWSGGAGEDCPLPELYRRLPSKPTLGAFHDALRSLHRSGRLHLHPWTGPLYSLPDPSLALLVGHEVAYYASTRAPARRLPELMTASH